MLTRIDPARISLGLAAVLVAAPFLFAEHRPPMPSFYDEWLGVTLAVLAVVAFLPRWRASIAAVPELALWLCAFAAWLAIQALLREPAYPQLAFAGIAYALLAAQLAWLGRSLAERFGTERVVDILATAILAGALANAAIGIVQHHGVPRVLAGLIGTAAGPRIVGHVGQPNILADYLALGQAALLYLLVRGRIRAAFWWAAAALLILASSYTQSRGAILFSLWICALACVFWRRGPAWQRLALHAAILALATLALMSLERVTAAASDPRLALWALAWQLFLGSPWLGVGWGEFAGAAFAAGLPAELAAYSPVWTSAHNVILQALAEAGIVGAAIVVMAAFRWWRDAWSAPTLASWWIAAVVGIVSLHALLEEPFLYAHVLALAALIAGAGSRSALKMPALPVRGYLALANLTAFVALAWALVDYQRFDRLYMVASGRTLVPAGEVTAALQELRAAEYGPLGAHIGPWVFRCMPPGAEELALALERGERALRRFPTREVVARHAATLALAAEAR